MQFKHPELLWALLLLFIPIIVHLFQLRRFKKTPFTNVKLLQKVVSESRRSSRLKEWLLLLTRIFLLSAIVLAFAQPYFAEKNALRARETIIYLDNSFSMQARSDESTLFGTALQDLIKTLPEDVSFSLFTNDKTFKNIEIGDIQNDLLTLPYTEEQLDLNQINLKARSLMDWKENTVKDLVIISDFQTSLGFAEPESPEELRRHLVWMESNPMTNVSIDSAYISNADITQLELTTLLSASTTLESTPVSLYNGDKLIAKTAAQFNAQRKSVVSFTLPPDELIKGRIEISDSGLSYDNQLFFSLDKKEKIKVLVIGEADHDFLRRIYTDDEFSYQAFRLSELEYGLLPQQNLIVLNELDSFSTGLQNALRSFVDGGGSLVVIPGENADLANYNSFLINFYQTGLTEKSLSPQKITTIAFEHPLYKQVFLKKVENFQYPSAENHYKIRSTTPGILALQGGDAFLSGTGSFYIFSTPLNSDNSNFSSSPLIVPTFYSMGMNSLKLPQLYHLTGTSNQLDVPLNLNADQILSVRKEDYEFIPRQQSFANKTSLSFEDVPEEDGIYEIRLQDQIYGQLAFNYSRSESDLSYLNPESLKKTRLQNDVESLLLEIEKENEVNMLWKWFVILALIFILTEVLIQKYFR